MRTSDEIIEADKTPDDLQGKAEEISGDVAKIVDGIFETIAQKGAI